MGKAIEQVKLGQVDRAANTLDVLIRDCGRNTQPVVREIVNSAARMSNVLEDHRGGPQE